MSQFNIWPDFGFERNPYSQDTLPASLVGDYLLVGRDDLSARVQRLIGTEGSFPTIEGRVGVGKSSLIEVSAFRMYAATVNAADHELFLPGTRRLQAMEDAEAFRDEVFRVLAETLVKYADVFPNVGLTRPNVEDLDQWLNASVYTSWQAGGGAASFNASTGFGEEGNTGSGYERSGFPNAVKRHLATAYSGGSGGVILILDNMELLETVADARQVLDRLRDGVFDIPHVRWVLSGSRGLIARARTDRLSGVFQAPLRVPALDDESVLEAITRRITQFGSVLATPPVTPEGFKFIYNALNRNLRDSLSTSQEFAQWVHVQYLANGTELPDPDDRDALLESWLLERAQEAHADAGRVQTRNWTFFDQLCGNGGSAGSSEHSEYGFAQQPGLVRAVTQLVDANLLGREVDPDSGTRTVNVVTPIGWLVYFFREQLGYAGRSRV